MLQQMLNLDGYVVGKLRELRMQLVHDTRGVGNAIKKIRIAESDVPRAGCNLLADISEYNIARKHTELAGINRHDRTMTAKMFAAARRFGITGGPMRAVRKHHMGVFAQWRQGRAGGACKGHAPAKDGG